MEMSRNDYGYPDMEEVEITPAQKEELRFLKKSWIVPWRITCVITIQKQKKPTQESERTYVCLSQSLDVKGLYYEQETKPL